MLRVRPAPERHVEPIKISEIALGLIQQSSSPIKLEPNEMAPVQGGHFAVGNRKRSRFRCLSHFLSENRCPLFQEML
jgi:hypothetical protein